MSPNELYEHHPPWLLLHILNVEEQELLPRGLYGREDVQAEVKKLRGKKMSSYEGLMDEFGAALQFFDGFGENWNALGECLSYLDEWMPADAYILVLTQPELVLLEEPVEDLATLTRIFKRTGEWWSKPIEDNDRFNRAAIPFHVVLQGTADSADEIRSRWGDVPRFERD